MSPKDRRAHPRYRVWVPARIRGADKPSRLAVSHDMSQSGSLLVTNTELKVGDRVSLAVSLPPDGKVELEIEARVLRSDVNVADPNGLWPFRAAVAFDTAQPALEKLLREHSDLLEGLSDDAGISPADDPSDG